MGLVRPAVFVRADDAYVLAELQLRGKGLPCFDATPCPHPGACACTRDARRDVVVGSARPLVIITLSNLLDVPGYHRVLQQRILHLLSTETTALRVVVYDADTARHPSFNTDVATYRHFLILLRVLRKSVLR